MVIPALITAASSLFGINKASSGQEQTNAQNVKIASRQMAFQKKANAKQMRFQNHMASTSYKRAMADMENSGLNPILAYKQGGAATPGGATSGGAGIAAQNPDAAYGDLGSKVAQAAQVYLNNKLQKSQIKNLTSTTALNNASAKTAAAQEKLTTLKQMTELATANNINANSAYTHQQTQTEANRTQITDFQIDSAVANSQIDMNKAKASDVEYLKTKIRDQVYKSGLGQAMIKLKEWSAISPNLSTIVKTLKKGK